MKTNIKIIRGDITKLAIDAIVNPANETLLGGGGVDGLIHYNAGIGLLEECKILGGCKKGEAKITKGHNLPAKWIIHTVGPFYGAENGAENELLRNCYLNCLLLAQKYQIKTIAFPSISTGGFHFPKDKAAEIAWQTVNEFVAQNTNTFEEVIFVCFTKIDHLVYNSIKEGTGSVLIGDILE